MKRKIASRMILFLVATALLLAIGCHNKPTSPIITSAEPSFLLQYSQYAPRVFAGQPDGKIYRIDRHVGPFYAIAFVQAPADAPDVIDPRLQALAERFWIDEIIVIQITLPPPSTNWPTETLAKLPVTTKNLQRWVDPKRIAWKAYHRPKPGTILIVDRLNLIPMIDTRGTLDQPDRIQRRLREMQREWEIDNQQDHSS